MSKYSLIVPVYKNVETIAALLLACEELDERLANQLELVFVVDGSPDASHAMLRDALPRASFRSQLVLLSRKFGCF